MSNDIKLLKSIFHDLMGELSNSNNELTVALQNELFWEFFNKILFDSSEIKGLFSQFKLEYSDDIDKSIDNLRQHYISQLALDYVNGSTNPTINNLIDSNNEIFLNEISFQKHLSTALSIIEYNNLKNQIKLFDLEKEFNIDDNEIESAFKVIQVIQEKEEHSLLKEKIERWNKQHSVQPVNSQYSSILTLSKTNNAKITRENKTRNIKFKLAVGIAIAACFIGTIITLGIFYNNNVSSNLTVLQKQDEQESMPAIADSIPVTDLALDHNKYSDFPEVITTERKINLIQQEGIGFASISKIDYKIKVHDFSIRLAMLKKYLMVNKERSEVISSEIDSLESLSGKYLFNKNTLDIFTKYPRNYINIIAYLDVFYLYDGQYFYIIKKTEIPDKLIRLRKNDNTYDILQKIIFVSETNHH